MGADILEELSDHLRKHLGKLLSLLVREEAPFILQTVGSGQSPGSPEVLWGEGCAQPSGVGLAPKRQLSYLSRAPVFLPVKWEPMFTPCLPFWGTAASSELMSENVCTCSTRRHSVVRRLCSGAGSCLVSLRMATDTAELG